MFKDVKFYIIGVVTVIVLSAGIIHAQTLNKPPDLNKLAALVNADRADLGLPALSRNSALDASASDKCLDMVHKNYWSHNSPEGNTPWVFIEKRYGNYKHAAENLAYGQTSVDDVNSQWLNSPEHEENIISTENDQVGYATCHDDNLDQMGSGYLIVQHFAHS